MVQVVAAGFTPMMTPDLVRESVFEKCGFQPRAQNTQVGRLCVLAGRGRGGWHLLPGPDEGFFSTSSCHLPRAGKGVTSTIR